MKYQKLMKKIMEQLNEYKNFVDRVSMSYLADYKRHEKELEGMRGKYTPEYIEENRRNWKPNTDYGKMISDEREKRKEVSDIWLDKIKSEIDSYFRVPVDSGFASTVTAIKNLGVTLNNREFELLQNASGGYWGMRLLGELGASRTKEVKKTKINDGSPEKVSEDVKNPYMTVAVPDVEKVYELLNGVENAVNEAFNSYCGKDYGLKDVVFPLNAMEEEKGNMINSEYGIKPRNQIRSTMDITRMATSAQYFDSDCMVYKDFLEVADGLAETLPKQKKKALTAKDKKLIDTLIDSQYTFMAKEKAIELAKVDEGLKEMLLLDERYSDTVKEGLRKEGIEV